MMHTLKDNVRKQLKEMEEKNKQKLEDIQEKTKPKKARNEQIS